MVGTTFTWPMTLSRFRISIFTWVSTIQAQVYEVYQTQLQQVVDLAPKHS